MTTVAVIGASGPVGQALLERLDGAPAVERIVGVDVVEPDMPVAKLDFAIADVRDRLLSVVLDGVDVVVNAALDLNPSADEDDAFARNVNGVRNLLEAASKAGVGKVVHLSDAMVYGAHADNPVPLTEESPLRANPDFAPGYQALLAEELIAGFASEHPSTAVAVLRPATVLGRGVDNVLVRHFEGPRLLCVRGYGPPVQVVHVDDLAAAAVLVATSDLAGVFNVAADGWLSVDELCTVLGRRRLGLPEVMAFAGSRQLWRRGLWGLPPGALHYLMHPWVMSAGKIHAAGWAPAHSNREVLREFTAERAGWLRLGPARLRRRSLYLVLAGAAGLGALGLLAGARRGVAALRGRGRR